MNVERSATIPSTGKASLVATRVMSWIPLGDKSTPTTRCPARVMSNASWPWPHPMSSKLALSCTKSAKKSTKTFLAHPVRPACRGKERHNRKPRKHYFRHTTFNPSQSATTNKKGHPQTGCPFINMTGLIILQLLRRRQLLALHQLQLQRHLLRRLPASHVVPECWRLRNHDR